MNTLIHCYYSLIVSGYIAYYFVLHFTSLLITVTEQYNKYHETKSLYLAGLLTVRPLLVVTTGVVNCWFCYCDFRFHVFSCMLIELIVQLFW